MRPKAAALALAAAAVAALALPTARAAEPVELRWRLEPGAVLRYRHTSEQESVQRDEGAGASAEPIRTRQVLEIEYRLTVLDRDAATGAARVLCRYDQVAIDLEQMMLGRVRFDSRKREDLARADEPAVKPFARLLGQEFSFLLSPSGAVSDVREHDKVRAAVLAGLDDSPYARLALGGAFGDEAVRSELERGFAVLPTATAAPGASWQRAFEQPIPLLGTLRYDLRFELAKLEEKRAEIAYAATLARAATASVREDPIAAAVEVEFRGGKGAGKALFDAAAGRLERSEGTLEMSLSTRLLPPVAPRDGSGAVSATNEVRQRVTVERLP